LNWSKFGQVGHSRDGEKVESVTTTSFHCTRCPRHGLKEGSSAETEVDHRSQSGGLRGCEFFSVDKTLVAS